MDTIACPAPKPWSPDPASPADTPLAVDTSFGALAASTGASTGNLAPGHARGPIAPEPAGEDGSIVTEYGLLVVVAATICGVVINWASNGQIVTLFNALMRQARALVGA